MRTVFVLLSTEAQNSQLYVAQSDSLGYIENNVQSTNSVIISNAVGQGDNIKHAEAVKLNLESVRRITLSTILRFRLKLQFEFVLSTNKCSRTAL